MKILSRYSLMVLLGIVSWLLVLVYNVFHTVAGFNANNNLSVDLPDLVVAAVYGTFLIVNMVAIRMGINRIEKWDVIDLLWKLLVVGITGLAATFVFQIVHHYLQDWALAQLIHPIWDSVTLYAFVIFMGTALFMYRKLIFYQKTKTKVVLWRTFEGLLLVAFLMLFYRETGPSDEGSIMGYVKSAMVPAFFILSLVISANVNWSAYLNFNQKLKSLFLILVIVLLLGTYYFTFPYDLFAGMVREKFFFDVLISENMIFALLYYFPLIYTLLSGLVIIFNLPTSSVFEQRSSEIASFQRINQSIQANLDLKEILNTLLDASLLTSNSPAGWIEVVSEKKAAEEEGEESAKKAEETEFIIQQYKHLTQSDVDAFRERIDFRQVIIKTQNAVHFKTLKKEKAFRSLKTKYRSLVAIPIHSREKAIGILYLLSELTNSFEEDTIKSLEAFAEQAAIAYENTQLMRQSIEFERYREQIRIARMVQEQILPSALPSAENIEFFAVAQDAEDIGGDFYDVLSVEEGKRYKVALGDVSGKGTEAAFYMAETKGIFQALAHLDLSSRDFVINANKALYSCLQDDSFLTLVYLHIDMEQNEIEMVRAGHVPALYYHARTDQLTYHEEGTMGMGIMTSPTFDAFVSEPEVITFEPGDMLLLYTDGIIEARSPEKVEFGYDRLLENVKKVRKEGSEAIARHLLEEVEHFTGGKIDDDYTILAIRFL